MKKLFLSISCLGLFLSFGAFFLAVRDVPFMLTFPSYVESGKKAKEHFDYYVRGQMISPFYNVHSRQLDLVKLGHEEEVIDRSQDKNTSHSIFNFYQQYFKYLPHNGEIAFLIAEDYARNGNFKKASDYLLKSYQLYPLSKKFGYERYRLGFYLKQYIQKEPFLSYRKKEYDIIYKDNS